MRCPDAIHNAVCEILRVGSLRARSAAWGGDAARSAIEIDHIHNLPGLLHDYSRDGLEFYWDCERSTFLQQVGAENVREFQQAWSELARCLKIATQPAGIE
jgi:hypothetical protein